MEEYLVMTSNVLATFGVFGAEDVRHIRGEHIHGARKVRCDRRRAALRKPIARQLFGQAFVRQLLRKAFVRQLLEKIVQKATVLLLVCVTSSRGDDVITSSPLITSSRGDGVAHASACYCTRCSVQVSGFGFRVSDFGFRISGFGFQVSGFGFRVSGFRFRVSGFGFWVSGSGFRGLGEW